MVEVSSQIPVFIDITRGNLHDVNALDRIQLPPGSYLVADRAYTDFERLYRLDQSGIYFFIRAKTGLAYRRRYSHPVDLATGARSDQSIMLTGPKTSTLYPDVLRRVHYYSAEMDRRFLYLTNNFNLSAYSVAEIYRRRWTIETFFRWIKQNLRIKSFFGTSINSVKTQIWISITVYLLIAILKKRLNLAPSLSQILQILSVRQFEKTQLKCLFDDVLSHNHSGPAGKQLILLDI